MKGKEKILKNAQNCYISHPCSEGTNVAIFIKFGTVVDLTYVITKAIFGSHRLKGGHFAAVQNLPFSHYLNGGPHNRQAPTCCRDWSLSITVPATLNSASKRLIRML